MIILGYIVTDRKMKGIDSFVEQVNDISLADSTKPILVVGWKNAKMYDGYKSVLDKTLGNNVFWTFSKSESRSEFEEDLEKFYKVIYNNILNNINYYYVNIFKLTYSKIKKIYNILFSNEYNDIYISNNMLYIPYKDNSILGVSLDIIEYCGIKRDKVISRIRSNPRNRMVDDGDGFIFRLSKRLGTKKYAMPYFVVKKEK